MHATPSQWDGQYLAGDWDYLAQIEQAARYGIIASWLRGRAQPARLIDLGCGEGVLLRYAWPSHVGSYLGVDHSEVAISRARNAWGHRPECRFLTGSAEAITEQQLRSADIVILNEVLYSLAGPLQLVRRILAAAPTVYFSITSYHPETIRLITRSLAHCIEELVECTDKKRSKAWTLGILRSSASQNST
jgi:SAM-dependent methyltransferase